MWKGAFCRFLISRKGEEQMKKQFLYAPSGKSPFIGEGIDERWTKEDGKWFMNNKRTTKTDREMYERMKQSDMPYIVLITDPVTRHLPKAYPFPDVVCIRPKRRIPHLRKEKTEFSESFVRRLSWTKEDFRVAQRAAEQVVLSERLVYRYEGDPLAHFRATCTEKQTTQFFIEDEYLTTFGATPEVIAEKKGRCFETTVLAGTAPVERLEKLQTTKEKEEHEMLVQAITQRLSIPFEQSDRFILPLRYVHHYATTLRLKTDNLFRCWSAIFPADTLVGTPREQASRIIERTERVSRQLFGGAVGLLSQKEEHFSLAIRMAVCAQGQVMYQSGAGITKESSEKEEREEMRKKRALFQLGAKKEETRREEENEHVSFID